MTFIALSVCSTSGNYQNVENYIDDLKSLESNDLHVVELASSDVC